MKLNDYVALIEQENSKVSQYTRPDFDYMVDMDISDSKYTECCGTEVSNDLVPGEVVECSSCYQMTEVVIDG
jgi:hypothetical protein